jgi:hypothetical protein
MTDAIANRALGSNSIYRASGADPVLQRQEPTPGPAAPSDPAERPAVVLSLSQEALGWLEQGAAKAGGASALENILAASDLEAQIAVIDRQEAGRNDNARALEQLNANYAKMRDTSPKPAVQLTAEQVADVLELAAPLGFDPSKIGGADNYIFGLDGMQYTFKKDGTAWVNESGVATSEEGRMRALQELENGLIAFVSARLEDRSSERAELVARRDALLAR